MARDTFRLGDDSYAARDAEDRYFEDFRERMAGLDEPGDRDMYEQDWHRSMPDDEPGVFVGPPNMMDEEGILQFKPLAPWEFMVDDETKWVCPSCLGLGYDAEILKEEGWEWRKCRTCSGLLWVTSPLSMSDYFDH